MNAIDALAAYQAPVMALLGGMLQFARQYSGFREWVYHVIALLLAFFGFALFHNVDLSDWRMGTIQILLGVSAALTSLWGGTFAASSLAKQAVINGAKDSNPMVPLTDSK